ncbi:nucleoporin subcomplex protein binding to Pom34-domain-containing protein [Podospora appendiculata]|uniref:Nucleoporin NUP188 n=1 Tax=Podospora appendiculata TaxID=314037 RepID=A0AAE0XFP2_9PEZI|nr:nucleoporin subcomplex protein binding to Pom34-domain-containing protein [Podospora appendiculata]
MASPTDRTYFPTLADCLKGKKVILSWKLVASALADTVGDRILSPAVSAFLKDAYIHQLLKAPAKTFEPPTPQSKTDFETKTAAINVDPTPNDRYDIAVIKEDVVWLSKNANINEVAALRVVVVEFQSRPQSHLTGPLSTQDVVHIQEAAGVSDAQTSTILALLNVSAVADAESTWADFETVTSRRQRILAHYLSERRSFMSAADSIMRFLLHYNTGSMGREVDVLRQAVVQDAFGFSDLTLQTSVLRFEAIIPAYINLLGACIERSQTGPATVDPDFVTQQLELDWARTSLTEAIHAMTITFQLLDLMGARFASQDTVSQWFRFVDTYEFLEPLYGDHELLMELVMPLRSLVCVISLKLLNVNRSMLYLEDDDDLELVEDEDPYLTSSDLLAQIHNTITAAANTNLTTASPVILAWSMILQRMHRAYQERAERRDLTQNQRAQDGFELEFQPSGSGRRNSTGSIVSIEKSPYDLFLSTQALERDTQPIERLAMQVTAGGQVHDVITSMSMCLGNNQSAAFPLVVGARMRAGFLELLKRSYEFIGYQSDSVSSLMSVLSAGMSYWDISSDKPLVKSQEVVAYLLGDSDLKESYLYQSLNRYPYEFLPFIQFCRILSTCLHSEDVPTESIITLLFNTETLTLEWKDSWNTYELIFEDENTNSFQTTETIDLFGSSWASKRRFGNEERFSIPAGTRGRFVIEGDGRVACLQYPHSALSLLGKRLEANLMADVYDTGLRHLESDEVAEAIAFLATILRVQDLKTSDPTLSIAEAETGTSVLREASRALPRTKDILTVVCDTLDSLVQEDLADIDGAMVAVMSSCVQFLDAALAVCPGRVWSYMTRCGLINGETRAGRLTRITGSLDLFSDRFDFLASAVKFFSSLVDSAMTSAIQRRAGTTAIVRSRDEEENPWLGTSDRILSRVALSVAQTAVDVFEHSATWRFPSEVDRSILVRDVVEIMQKLISYSFSIGTTESSTGLTASLEPAARYVVESFVSTSASSLRFQPLLATLLVAFQIPDSTLYPQRSRIVSARVSRALNFATTLLRVASYLDQPSAGIQTQLFRSASLVARLPAIGHSFKTSAMSLLSALVESAGKGSSEPPSLLGYLGPQVTRSFIQIASQLDKPFERMPEMLSTWKFFSTILRNRQQWMANCLLTGKTPREALKGDGKVSKLATDSMLSTALEKLSAISKLPSQESMAILDFFTSAQNFWPWTIFAMQKETAFLSDLRAYVRDLKSPSVMSKSDPKEAGNQARIAAYIAETFAMQLYHLRQTGQAKTFAGAVVNDLDYFLRNGVQVSGYNASLHANFAKNFTNKYPGCSVDDFKRTVLVPRDLGPQYYYALDLAEAMLKNDSGWAGPRKNGFRHEMETANLNLSLVEAEVALFHAWEYLLLELSISLLPANATVAKQMLQVAEQCLEANQRAQPPENIFIRLSHSRANLALTLVQRLADSSHLPKDTAKLLMSMSVAISGVENPYGKEQISYTRTLLKILFIVLRGSKHSANSATQPNPFDSPVAVTQLVLTILDRVVARSFRTLVTLVHEAESPTSPEDLALITAILQACLSTPGIEQCQVQILNIMSSFEVLQVATSLFSWADKLADKGDPIYGELAILFLLELSALPTIAEQLACDGILGHIISANLAGFMRRANVSPLADNAGAARCYGIWAKGILPLLLNVLGALGATIAPEVAFVLNQFPNLLAASVERFEAPGTSRTAARDAPQFVTLVAVSEIHSLALLTRVLGAHRVNNSRDIPEVVWDAGSVAENVEFWLTSRRVLRERLLPLGPRESDWRATKATEGSGCESRLEEKAVGLLEAVRDVLSEDLE